MGRRLHLHARTDREEVKDDGETLPENATPECGHRSVRVPSTICGLLESSRRGPTVSRLLASKDSDASSHANCSTFSQPCRCPAFLLNTLSHGIRTTCRHPTGAENGRRALRRMTGDRLHSSLKEFQVWANALKPFLKELLGNLRKSSPRRLEIRAPRRRPQRKLRGLERKSRMMLHQCRVLGKNPVRTDIDQRGFTARDACVEAATLPRASCRIAAVRRGRHRSRRSPCVADCGGIVSRSSTADEDAPGGGRDRAAPAGAPRVLSFRGATGRRGAREGCARGRRRE